MIPPLSKSIETLLSAPLAQWSQLYTSTAVPGNTQDLVREIDALLEKAAMLRAYLDTRQNPQGSDLGHDRAVKSANSLKTKIRRALGYSIPNQPVTF